MRSENTTYLCLNLGNEDVIETVLSQKTHRCEVVEHVGEAGLGWVLVEVAPRHGVGVVEVGLLGADVAVHLVRVGPLLLVVAQLARLVPLIKHKRD